MLNLLWNSVFKQPLKIMKKFVITALSLVGLMLFAPGEMRAFDLEALLGKASELGIIPSDGDTFDMARLTGDWKYKAPAVSFKTENLLKKAGGVATSALIEKKIAPYYKKVGFDRMTLAVRPDSTFTMSLPTMSLSGELLPLAAADGEPDMKMMFKVLGVTALSIDAYVSKPGNTVTITFDASKLVSLVKFAAKVTGSSSAKALSSILEAYDGVNAGFELSKTSD